jgi:hypothetical protein
VIRNIGVVTYDYWQQPSGYKMKEIRKIAKPNKASAFLATLRVFTILSSKAHCQ